MDRWMPRNGWMDRWKNGRRMNGWMMDKQTGQMDEWMGGWMNGQTDGWIWVVK